MTKIMNPTKAFEYRIKSLYDTEKQLESALPKMARAATSPELAAGFREHLEETKVQSERLENIFKMIDVTPRKQTGETIRALIADGKTKMEMDAPDALKDQMIAGAGRDVEHFEMACYMNAILEAKGLGLYDVAELLEMTLAEEIVADEKLEVAFKNNLVLAGEEALQGMESE